VTVVERRGSNRAVKLHTAKPRINSSVHLEVSQKLRRHLMIRHTHITTIAMLLPRTGAVPSSTRSCLKTLENALSNLRLPQNSIAKQTTAVRNSTSLAQGRANGAKDGAGKRLGAKKSGGTIYSLPVVTKAQMSGLTRHFLLLQSNT